MKLTHAVIHQLHLPLVSPFRTSFGTETARQVLLVQVIGPDTQGWGECVADALPLYSSEYSDGAAQMIKRFLLPRLDPANVVASTVSDMMSSVNGHPMAKGGIEAAVLDAECRLYGQPLSERLGATKDRVPAGVSVGIHDSIPALLDTVEGYVAEGYLRIKLKIEPGNDIAHVAAVRERFPDILLQVDANCAYTLADAAVLARLDAFDLLLIEQPLPEDDVRGHAQLARLVRTPICLDESITSPGKPCRRVKLSPDPLIDQPLAMFPRFKGMPRFASGPSACAVGSEQALALGVGDHDVGGFGEVEHRPCAFIQSVTIDPRRPHRLDATLPGGEVSFGARQVRDGDLEVTGALRGGVEAALALLGLRQEVGDERKKDRRSDCGLGLSLDEGGEVHGSAGQAILT